MVRWTTLGALLALALGGGSGGGRGPSGALAGYTIDPNDKGEPLFADGHPNITYLTDKNWNEHLAKTDKPWLIDFYHPLYVCAPSKRPLLVSWI